MSSVLRPQSVQAQLLGHQGSLAGSSVDEANDGTPDSMVAHSNQPVDWLCDACHHKWSASPNHRVCKNAGCPKCSHAAKKDKKQIRQPTFADCKGPEVRALLAQWDHPCNAEHGHFPDKVRLRSNKQILWLCTNCPAGQEHSWPARPCDCMKPSRTGCPFCAGRDACKCNSLQALYSDIAAEWDYAKNKDQPSDYTASSGYLAWWFSPKRGSPSIRAPIRCSRGLQG